MIHARPRSIRTRAALVTLTLTASSSLLFIAGTSAPAVAAVPAAPAGWTTAFSDDFSGAANTPIDSNWIYDLGTSYPGGAGNFGTGEVETVTSSTTNVYQDGAGHLVIKPVRDASGNWTSGRVETARTDFAAPAGGEMELTASLEQPNPANGIGYWPAFWAMGAAARPVGATNWPSIGELDVMEDVNALSEVSHTFHCGVDPGGPCNETTGIGSGLLACAGCQTAYHTYSVIVDRTNTSAEQLRFYTDGVLQHTVNESQVPTDTWTAAVDHGFFGILNVAIGGQYPFNVCGCTNPTAATSSGAGMSVDYVAVYTKAASGTTVATPTFTPAGGSYTSAQSVTIADSTSGAAIHYTTDGSTPTASSATYSGPVTVAATETLNAIGVVSGDNNSAVATASYTIGSTTPTVATPTFTPAGGTYSTTQSVTIADSTSGAAIHYTTDGSTPTASSATYTGAISVATTKTVKAIGTLSGSTSSAVASATYTISSATGDFTQTAAQQTSTSALISFTPTIPAAYVDIHYTVNGGGQQNVRMTLSGSTWTQTVTGLSSGNVIAYWFTYEKSGAQYDSAHFSYTQGSSGTTTVATPTFTPAAGTYATTQSVTIADSTSGAAIHYTTDGSTPTASSATYTGAISVAATTTVQAIGTLSGSTTSAVASATYTISAATGDFSQSATRVNATQALISFTPTTAAAYVDIHYTVSGGGQQNVRMTLSGSTWTQTISGLSSGNVITYWFTYEKSGAQYDSAHFSYTQT